MWTNIVPIFSLPRASARSRMNLRNRDAGTPTGSCGFPVAFISTLSESLYLSLCACTTASRRTGSFLLVYPRERHSCASIACWMRSVPARSFCESPPGWPDPKRSTPGPVFSAGRAEAQCHLVFPKAGILHNLWGGPPGRGALWARSPWARSSLEESGVRNRQQADRGVGRGRGRPPHPATQSTSLLSRAPHARGRAPPNNCAVILCAGP